MLAGRKRTLERLAGAVRSRQAPLPVLLDRGPIGVAFTAVDAGDRRVQAAQLGPAVDGVAIEMERRVALVLLEPGLGDESQAQGRFGDLFQEAVEAVPRQRLVCLGQVEPRGRIGGGHHGEPAQVGLGLGVALEAHESLGQHGARVPVVGLEPDRLLERSHRLDVPAEPQVGGAQEQRRGERARLEPQCRVESGNRLLVLAGKVEGHAQVQEEAGVAGHRIDQLAIDGNGLGVTARGHQLLSEPGFRGQLLFVCARLRARGRDQGHQYKKKASSVHASNPGSSATAASRSKPESYSQRQL